MLRKEWEAEMVFPYEAVDGMILFMIGDSLVEMRGGSPKGRAIGTRRKTKRKRPSSYDSWSWRPAICSHCTERFFANREARPRSRANSTRNIPCDCLRSGESYPTERPLPLVTEKEKKMMFPCGNRSAMGFRLLWPIPKKGRGKSGKEMIPTSVADDRYCSRLVCA